MTIEKYLAENNPQEVAAILELNGSRKINKKNIEAVLLRFTEKKGDFAFEQLAKIDTPYRRLILSNSDEVQMATWSKLYWNWKNKAEAKSNCGGDEDCGCAEKKSNCCGGSNADGDTKSEKEQFNGMSAISFMLIGGAFLLGVLAIKAVKQ